MRQVVYGVEIENYENFVFKLDIKLKGKKKIK